MQLRTIGLIFSLLLVDNVFCQSQTSQPDVADSLYCIGIDNYNKHNYANAILCFRKCDSLNKSIQRSLPYLCNNADHWVQYLSLKNQQIDEENYEYNPEHIPFDCRILSAIYLNIVMAGEIYDKEEYVSAAEHYKECAEYGETVLGNDHYFPLLMWEMVGNCYSLCSNWDLAQKNYLHCVKIITQRYNFSWLDYANILYNLSDTYIHKDDYISAYVFCLEAYLNYYFTLGEDHEYSKTIKTDRLLQVEEQFKKSVDNNGAETIHRAIQIAESNLPPNSPVIANLYFQLGNEYVKTPSSYQDGLSAYLHTLDEIPEQYDPNNADRAMIMHNIAATYGKMEQNGEAIRFEDRALSLIKNTYGEKSFEYINALDAQSNFFSGLGEEQRALDCSVYALQLGFELLQNIVSLEQQPDTAWIVEFLTLYSRVYEGYLGCVYTIYGSAKITQDNLVSIIDQTEKILDYYRAGKDNHEGDPQVITEIRRGYAAIATNLANFYLFYENFEKSKLLLDDVLSIKDLSDEQKCFSLSAKGILLQAMGDFTDALDYKLQSATIYQKIYSKSLHTLGLLNLSIAESYRMAGNWQLAGKYLSKGFELHRTYIRQQFACLTSGQRMNLWASRKFDILNYIRMAYESDNKNPLMNCTAYDAALLLKGLLLSSDIELFSLLRKSNDTEILHNVERMLKLQVKIDRQSQLHLSREEIAGMLQDIYETERNLLAKSKIYGDYTSFLHTDWRDIAATLKPNSYAVEFINIPLIDKDRYIAFILGYGWSSPKCVDLGEANDFAKYVTQNDAIYISNELSGKIWSQIIETAQVKEGDNIYFSPDGVFHQLAIEYLPTEDGRAMSEKYNIERLSSTKELCFREQNRKETSAVLYGGLKYNLDTDAIISESRKFDKSSNMRGDNFFTRFFSGKDADSVMRSSLKYLPGTLIEVENISSTLNDKGVEIKKYTAENGNEESFKALSGHTPQIIHIATHGFYLPPTEAELLSKQQQVSFLSFTDDQKTNVIDYSMSRTGLLFAGAQAAWSGRPLPENVDDGILTAKEISQLDLRDVDLAVLSACQTALGEITGDGVAGLQRGFKKAGVKTLVMSLWPVDDQATRIMMTAFYKNLTSGHSKREAFNSAMLALRNYEAESEIEVDDTDQQKIYDETADDYVYPKKIIHEKRKPYTDPKYWAAFIMLD